MKKKSCKLRRSTVTRTEYEGVLLPRGWLSSSKGQQRRGEEEEKRKRNGYEGGKRWDLLEVCCACGRKGGSGREALKKSEKIEHLANGRSDASFRSTPYTGRVSGRIFEPSRHGVPVR
jgi:hypothetical protein